MFTLVAAWALGHAPDLIASVRHALTVPDAKPWAETTLTGSAKYYALDGQYELRYTRDGKFIQAVKNELGDTNGFDGKTNWTADYSGATRETRFEGADLERGILMLCTSQWVDAGAPVELKVDGSQIHLKLRNSPFEETVNIDTATNLPRSAFLTASSGMVQVTFSDWKPAGDHLVPFTVGVTSGGLTDTFKVDHAAGGEDPGRAAFAMPDWKPTDTQYDDSKPAAIETRKAFTGHVLVHPRVNGKDIGWFILDSGAEIMVIDGKVADTLGLPKLGEEQLVGVGGSTTASFRTSDSFTLGKATLSHVRYIEYDLSEFGKLMGVKVSGVVGYDFMRRTIIGVDLAKPQITVDNPSKFTLPGKWTPMWFDSGNPVVEATLEGDHKGFFRLDTGANGTVTLHTPFTKQFHLLDGRKTTSAMMGGVGGMMEGQMGRLKWFELGGHRFENPLVVFATGTTGAFSSRYLAGNIGQEFMMPFDMILDFGGSRVGFLPKPAHSARLKNQRRFSDLSLGKADRLPEPLLSFVGRRR